MEAGTIDDRWRVVLPASLRKRFKRGQRVVFDPDESGVRIRPAEDPFLALPPLKLPKRYREMDWSELEKVIEDELASPD